MTFPETATDAANLRATTLSVLGWLGALMGKKTIADTLADDDVRRFTSDMARREIIPYLDSEEMDIQGTQLITALCGDTGAAIEISTLVANGSETLADNLLTPIRARIAAGEPAIRLSLGVAAWIRYASGMDDDGHLVEIVDPMAGRLHFLGQQARTNPDALGTAFLGLTEIFDDDLSNQVLFRQQVITHLGQLLHQGAAATVSAVVNGPE
jgi:fructuronate reductase